MACIANAATDLQYDGITGFMGICHLKQRIAKLTHLHVELAICSQFKMIPVDNVYEENHLPDFVDYF